MIGSIFKKDTILCKGQTNHPFVESSENRLGIGKLIEVNGETAFVEYFRSPTDEEQICKEVLRKTLTCRLLPLEARVFYRNPETHTIEVGRVLDYQKEDQAYLIRFPNKQSRMISSDDLLVRCRLPIEEPTDHLASQVNETAFWHTARSKFVRHLLNQHRISQGLSALLSSSVEIVAHQVSVIHRVLMDPFQRYLLADEVGLGKTIEAGVLIKQFVFDEPNDHQTIVIVPDALLIQWRQELTHRFHLGNLIDDSIQIVASRDVDTIARMIPNARMIVIDEAHHLCSWAWSLDPMEKAVFDTVKFAAEKYERRVLLLSATPILHNEQSFLAMLHLLDPQIYPLESLELLKERVRLRQEIAERLMDLREDESNFFLGDTLEVLGKLLSQDKEFQSLRGQLAELIVEDVEESDPQRISLIQSIRTHISDMWRLHRRILRNRRTQSTSVYLPGRGGVEQIVFECDSERDLAKAIETWRLTLSSALYFEGEKDKKVASDLVRLMDEFAACEPRLALKFAMQRLEDGGSEATCSFPLREGEIDTLHQIIRAAKGCDQIDKLEVLLRLVETEDTGLSYVIFASEPETADLIFKFLDLRLPSGRTLRHSTKSPKWTRFKNEHGNFVLICDRSAEEGLNLQKRGTCAIHYDMPFSPNRIEQRMGRLDRFGSGKAIQSVVLVSGGSNVQKKWFDFLDSGLNVFNHSIASLQYVIEEVMHNIWGMFLDSGSEAFDEFRERVEGNNGIVATEFKRIRAQDEIDSFETDTITQQFINDLENKDRECSFVSPSIFNDWIIHNMQFTKTGEERRRDEVITYNFTRRVDNGGRRPFGKNTLMPAEDFQRLFSHSIDDLDVKKPTKFISVPFAFDRVTAQKRSCRLLRVGDPFVDAFEDFTEWDDRGISFAFWRYIEDYCTIEDPDVFFCFNYVISPSDQAFNSLCDRYPGISRNALIRRSRAIMKPLFKTIWLDADLEEVVPNDDHYKLLQQGYDKDSTTSKRDYNLNRDRWNSVAKIYDMSLWRDRCFAAREQSERLLREHSKLPEWSDKCVNEAKYQASKIQQQFRSRLVKASGETKVLLGSDMAFEQSFLESQIESFRNPNLRADSVGAVFISNQKPFTEHQSDVEEED
ncbi:MAG: hypothetical protein CME32_17820 [Gimesia sp.]|nr:hypothetical protein [Gimesia sp.]